MAYSRRGKSRRTTVRRTRRAAPRARRTTARRGRGNSSRAQTVRIELVSPGATLARPMNVGAFQTAAPAPGKAKF